MVNQIHNTSIAKNKGSRLDQFSDWWAGVFINKNMKIEPEKLRDFKKSGLS